MMYKYRKKKIRESMKNYTIEKFINKYLQGWDDIKKPYSYSVGRTANPLSNIIVPDHIGKGQEVIMKQVPKDMDLQRRHQDYLKWFVGATKDYYKIH